MDVAAKTLRTKLKALSLRRNMFLSDLYPVYSPGWRSKKWAMIIILVNNMRRGSPDAVAILEIWQRTWRVVGLTQLGGGSCLLLHRYLNRIWISGLT